MKKQSWLTIVVFLLAIGNGLIYFCNGGIFYLMAALFISCIGLLMID